MHYFVPMRRYLDHLDSVGQETELDHICGRHIEKRVTRCLAVLSKVHSEMEVHLRQLAALLHSHCYMNQKTGYEVVTAGNSR